MNYLAVVNFHFRFFILIIFKTIFNLLAFLVISQSLSEDFTRNINPLSANPTKWSNTLKQFVGSVSVFDHFARLTLKGLSNRVVKNFQFISVAYASFGSLGLGQKMTLESYQLLFVTTFR